MKRKSIRNFWQSPVLLLFIISTGCVTTRHEVRIEHFENPPYGKVVLCLKPQVNLDQINRLPKLNPGETMAVFPDSPEKYGIGFCDKPTVLKVEQPLKENKIEVTELQLKMGLTKSTLPIEYIERSGSLSISKTEQEMESISAEGRMGIAKGGESIASHSEQGQLRTTRMRTAIAQHEKKSHLKTTTHEDAIELNSHKDTFETKHKVAHISTKHQERTVQTKKQDQTLQFTQDKQRILSQTGKKVIASSEAKKETFTQKKDRLKSKTTKQTVMVPILMKEKKISPVTQQAGIGPEIDESLLSGLDDSGLIALLEDLGFKDGFFDETGEVILLWDMVEITSEELSGLRRILDGSRGLDQLINRKLSAFLRPKDGLAEGNRAATIKIEPLYQDIFYHGMEVLLSIKLINTRKETLYDTIMALQVPDHATFKRFTAMPGTQRGYAQMFFPAEGMMFWKLYRPIEPKQGFQAGFIIKLDPWSVDDLAAKDKIR